MKKYSDISDNLLSKSRSLLQISNHQFVNLKILKHSIKLCYYYSI